MTSFQVHHFGTSRSPPAGMTRPVFLSEIGFGLGYHVPAGVSTRSDNDISSRKHPGHTHRITQEERSLCNWHPR